MQGTQVKEPLISQTKEQKRGDHEKRNLRHENFINRNDISPFKGNLAGYLASMMYCYGSIHYLEPGSESDSDF